MFLRRALTPIVVGGLASGALFVGPSCPPAAASASTVATQISVHVGRATGPINRALVGFDFHFGGPAPATIAGLRPHFVRLDASLERISPARGVLHLAGLQRQVAQLRAIGAEPLVILDYTPAWLGQLVAPFGDRTKTEPSDLAVWRALVGRVVTALATGPGRVRWFEAWNEPDLPTYWAGTQQAWFDTAAASAQAVHDAALRTRLALRFGGPASFHPDAAQIGGFVSRLRADRLPPAFVSWHYYANYPCLGPDGPENPSDPTSVALQRALGCFNPAASPITYSPGIAVVRSAIASASGGAPSPPLVLDEWNLSAGGLDLRMSSNVGAAFDAGTLITFQQDKLDAAAFYQATDTDARPGGWGTVTSTGKRRPSWSIFRLWDALAPLAVAVDGSDPNAGLYVVGSRDARTRRVTVLLASFSASSATARSITLDLLGRPRSPGRWTATVQRVDAQHDGGQRPRQVSVSRAGSVKLALPAQAVALVTLSKSRR